jgi:cytochrome P450
VSPVAISFVFIIRLFFASIAGSHTAAASTAAILHLLLKHQNVYKKLMQELNVLGENEVPTYEQLKDLPYLQATITEGLVLAHFKQDITR